jgi:hypothetical protein
MREFYKLVPSGTCWCCSWSQSRNSLDLRCTWAKSYETYLRVFWFECLTTPQMLGSSRNGRILHLTNSNKSQSRLTNLQIKNICLQVYKNLFSTTIFPVGYAGQGVTKQNSTFWLDGARPVNTFIPPSFLGNTPTQLCSTPTPKSMFANVWKLFESIE